MNIALFSGLPFCIHVARALHEPELLKMAIVPERSDFQTREYIKELERMQIPVYRVTRKKLSTLPDVMAQNGIDTGIIIYFAYILPKAVPDSCKFGIYNFHPSDLPRYRGPEPLFWQLKNDEKTCTLTLHAAQEEVDEGDILWQDKIPIRPTDTRNTLQNTSVLMAAKLMKSLPDLLSEGTRRNQEGNATYTTVPTMEDLKVRWEKMGVSAICALCRAANPTYGGAKILWHGLPLGLMQASPVSNSPEASLPGTVLKTEEPHGLIVNALDGIIKLDIIHSGEGTFTGSHFASRFVIKKGFRFT